MFAYRAAVISVKDWLVIHSNLLARCIVGVVAFTACLLPEEAGRGILGVTYILASTQVRFGVYRHASLTVHHTNKKRRK